MTPEAVAEGRWVTLYRPRSDEELAAIYALRRDQPRTPQENVHGRGTSGPLGTDHGPLGPLLVRDRRTRQAYGVASGFRLHGTATLHLSVFLDPHISHPGVGVEAYLLYARAAIDAGAHGVHLSVLDCDTIGKRMLDRLGVPPRVRFREHSWSGGRLHDLLIYALDDDTLQAAGRRAEALLSGRPEAES